MLKYNNGIINIIWCERLIIHKLEVRGTYSGSCEQIDVKVRVVYS